jgi:DNA invertase Pin-like site-specific DNA recombinase
MSDSRNENGNWLQRIFSSVSGTESEEAPVRPAESAGPPGRAYIYTRPQRNDKGELVDDNDQQVDRCQEYARINGYRVTRILQEPEHGPEDERAVLKELRTAIWKGQLDILVTPKPETIYYDTNRLVRLTRELSMMDARIEFVDVDINQYELEDENDA